MRTLRGEEDFCNINLSLQEPWITTRINPGAVEARVAA